MTDPRVVTTLASFRAAARGLADRRPSSASGDAGDSGSGPGPEATTRGSYRLPVEVQVTVDDPFLAYRRARDGAGDGGAYLETTGGQPGWGYFGIDPVDRLTCSPDAVARRDESDDPTHDTSTHDGHGAPSLAALEGLLDGDRLVRGDCDVPYPCGAIGWLSYDVAREFEALPAGAVDDRGLPRLEVGVYDRLAAWEEPIDGGTGADESDESDIDAGDADANETNTDDDADSGSVTLRITACPRLETDDDGEPKLTADAIERTYERGRERALDLARAVRDGDPGIGEPPVATPEATFESDCGREAFAERVRRVKEYIRDGDTFQANISQRLAAPAAVHPVAAYDALRRVNPAPYSCLLEFRAADLVSASPELLLERGGPRSPSSSSGGPPRERDGEFVRTEPIAGTRPRGETPEEDAALEADLLSDEKERAEHAMLVDLERNDLGKVCEYGSVAVEEYRRIDRYSEVMHLVSNVTGRLRPAETLADAVAAVFPGGTITGAPKPRTMEIIDELEATRRGPYTGSVGVFGFDGRATLNIVIRTLVRHADEYLLRVGAGIVHDSDPDREYDETLAKARALITAVDEALGERAGLALEADGSGDNSGGATDD